MQGGSGGARACADDGHCAACVPPGGASARAKHAVVDRLGSGRRWGRSRRGRSGRTAAVPLGAAVLSGEDDGEDNGGEDEMTAQRRLPRRKRKRRSRVGEKKERKRGPLIVQSTFSPGLGHRP